MNKNNKLVKVLLASSLLLPGIAPLATGVTSVSAATEVAANEDLYYRVVTEEAVRFRTEENAKPVALVSRGDKVKFVKEVNTKWFEVEVDGETGYILRGNVTSEDNYTNEDTGIHEVAVKQEAGAEDSYAVAVSTALRTKDEERYRPLSTLKRGETVEYLGTTANNWFKVKANGVEGYVKREDVTKHSNMENGQEADLSYDTYEEEQNPALDLLEATITTALRTRPGSQYSALDEVPRGAKVEYLGTVTPETDWFLVEVDGSTQGYIHRNHVTKVEREEVGDLTVESVSAINGTVTVTMNEDVTEVPEDLTITVNGEDLELDAKIVDGKVEITVPEIEAPEEGVTEVTYAVILGEVTKEATLKVAAMGELEPGTATVAYEIENEVTEISNDAVKYEDGSFLVPTDVTEFTFKDGELEVTATRDEDQWIFTTDAAEIEPGQKTEYGKAKEAVEAYEAKVATEDDVLGLVEDADLLNEVSAMKTPAFNKVQLVEGEEKDALLDRLNVAHDRVIAATVVSALQDATEELTEDNLAWAKNRLSSANRVPRLVEDEETRDALMELVEVEEDKIEKFEKYVADAIKAVNEASNQLQMKDALVNAGADFVADNIDKYKEAFGKGNDQYDSLKDIVEKVDEINTKAANAEKFIEIEKELNKAYPNQLKINDILTNNFENVDQDHIVEYVDAIFTDKKVNVDTFEKLQDKIDEVNKDIADAKALAEAVKAAQEAIENLPDEITLEDKAEVEAARALVDEAEELKGYTGIGNIGKKLVAAENKIAALETEAKDKAAAKVVEDLFLDLPAADDVTLDHKEQIETALNALNKLTPGQETLIDINAVVKKNNAVNALNTQKDLLAKAETRLTQADNNKMNEELLEAAQKDLNAAKGHAEDLKSSVAKDELVKKINAVQSIIDEMNAGLEANDALVAATEEVEKAEGNIIANDYVNAQKRYDEAYKLVNGVEDDEEYPGLINSDAKDELNDRLAKVKAALDEATIAEVSTSKQLIDALADENVKEIIVTGTIGEVDSDVTYKVENNGVTIKGTEGSKVYGSFDVIGDDITVEGLTIEGRRQEGPVVHLGGDNATIIGNTIIAPDHIYSAIGTHSLGGNQEGKYVISDNIVTGAIGVGTAKEIVITNNTVTATEAMTEGIFVYPSTAETVITITGNKVGEVKDGMYQIKISPDGKNSETPQASKPKSVNEKTISVEMYQSLVDQNNDATVLLTWTE